MFLNKRLLIILLPLKMCHLRMHVPSPKYGPDCEYNTHQWMGMKLVVFGRLRDRETVNRARKI